MNLNQVCNLFSGQNQSGSNEELRKSETRDTQKVVLHSHMKEESLQWDFRTLWQIVLVGLDHLSILGHPAKKVTFLTALQ
mmetsp:Transcript_9760/g.17463  ORF Transcript_9760/g.17463 Transcript_9760/m.17463 type:complete len:80 (+) Transcript_9760:310-549(+)